MREALFLISSLKINLASILRRYAWRYHWQLEIWYWMSVPPREDYFGQLFGWTCLCKCLASGASCSSHRGRHTWGTVTVPQCSVEKINVCLWLTARTCSGPCRLSSSLFCRCWWSLTRMSRTRRQKRQCPCPSPPCPSGSRRDRSRFVFSVSCLTVSSEFSTHRSNQSGDEGHFFFESQQRDVPGARNDLLLVHLNPFSRNSDALDLIFFGECRLWFVRQTEVNS